MNIDQLYTGALVSNIGKTATIELKSLFSNTLRVYAKLEEQNPGGSIKARTALALLRDAHQKKILKNDSVIVESSSGNLGLALAKLCRCVGLKFICIVDIRTNIETIRLLEVHGAEVMVVTMPDADTHSLLETRIKRVKEILAKMPNALWLNQYENPANPLAHRETMKQFLTELPALPDYFFCAISTCGTLRGCSLTLRELSPNTKIIAVDAAGSCIFSSTEVARRLPGYGAGFRPPLFDEALFDYSVRVTDIDAVKACHLALNREGLLIGASSGAVVSALTSMQDSLPSGSTCAMIFPDGGDRYCDTVYSMDWVRKVFSADEVAELECLESFAPNYSSELGQQIRAETRGV